METTTMLWVAQGIERAKEKRINDPRMIASWLCSGLSVDSEVDVGSAQHSLPTVGS